MKSFSKEVAVVPLCLLPSIVLGVLLATPAFAAKNERPLWLQVYKMIPQDAWTLAAVVAIVVVVWALFYRHMKDCKCKCGIYCKCDCKCSASCPCQIPVLKLKR